MMKRVITYFKPKPETKNMKIGRDQEKNALENYARNSPDPLIRLGLIVHPTCPWLGCSPDGYVDVATKTVIEVKTLINEKNDQFQIALNKVSYLKFSNGKFVLKEKHKYYAQIQVNMFLLRCGVGHLVVYNYKTDEIKVIVVALDDSFVNKLVSVLQQVYFTFMLPYIYENFVTDEDKTKYE